MYCPKCGTQNLEDIKFCRLCGANLSLVPQALSGKLPQERAVGYDSEGHPYDKHGHRIRSTPQEPSISRGIQHVFLGLGFLIIAAVLFFTHQRWGLWMLIPAFGLIGKGFADIAAFKVSQQQAPMTAPPPARTTGDLATGELAPRQSHSALPPQPPSVTENTTRHLDATREQQPRDNR